MAQVLVVDDDVAVGTSLGDLIRQAGIATRFVASAPEALAALAEAPVDVVITDLRMPGMDGMALLERLKARSPEVAVVVLTAHGSVPLAVRAMQAGAADFILKPFDREEVLRSVRKALAVARHAGEAVPPADAPSSPAELLDGGGGLAEVASLLRRAAQSAATVLLQGETGTGKSLAARAIHAQGPRAGAPLVTVHCGALPETLLESELFGHEKGAFTGAVSRKPGRVELASAGTLFLDEIGDIAPSAQAKLLRLLQERTYEPLGATRSQRSEARFIAATHHDLDALAARGAFRRDLFYRLSVLVIRLPPLRDRRGDIPGLSRAFCARHALANGKPGARLDDAALARLAAQPWPGNVRQLENFVERLVVFADALVIGAADVDAALSAALPSADSLTGGAGGAGAADAPLEAQRRAAEREAIDHALSRAGGNRTMAARLLGVSRRTLYNKLSELGVDPPVPGRGPRSTASG